MTVTVISGPPDLSRTVSPFLNSAIKSSLTLGFGMSLWQRKIKASEIGLVSTAQFFSDPREPALRVGCFVRLNSGGPIMMVVDCEDGP